ncbi:hypothetical protein RRG08_061160 [Elysia crispata]|uniref:Uncharacterized protein n=1 Tax=Elysia crispata TaxID=231223 RepID=A0AAE1CEE3_9GAST|nr:hypothetical protein RRG08_061160 [Elysia crispata]
MFTRERTGSPQQGRQFIPASRDVRRDMMRSHQVTSDENSVKVAAFISLTSVYHRASSAVQRSFQSETPVVKE